MAGSALDSELIQIVSGPPPATIADVLAVMQRIDNLLAPSDGLKWFNLLYMKVTEEVDNTAPPGGWENPAWLTRLDIIFAQLYLTAISNWPNKLRRRPQFVAGVVRSALQPRC